MLLPLSGEQNFLDAPLIKSGLVLMDGLLILGVHRNVSDRKSLCYESILLRAAQYL